MRLDSKPFGQTLSDGELWEYRAARAVSRKLGYTFRISGERSADLVFFVPQRAEVKTDHKAEQTGNVYIETRNTRQGVDSGLASEGADLWIQCIPHLGAIYLCRRSELLAYLAMSSDLRQVDGGDDNSHGYLIPIDQFEKLPFIQKIPLEGWK